MKKAIILAVGISACVINTQTATEQVPLLVQAPKSVEAATQVVLNAVKAPIDVTADTRSAEGQRNRVWADSEKVHLRN